MCTVTLVYFNQVNDSHHLKLGFLCIYIHDMSLAHLHYDIITSVVSAEVWLILINYTCFVLSIYMDTYMFLPSCKECRLQIDEFL